MTFPTSTLVGRTKAMWLVRAVHLTNVCLRGGYVIQFVGGSKLKSTIMLQPNYQVCAGRQDE